MTQEDDEWDAAGGLMFFVGDTTASDKLQVDLGQFGLYQGMMDQDDDKEIRELLSHSILTVKTAATYGVTPEELTDEFLKAKIDENAKLQKLRMRESVERSGGAIVDMETVRKQAAQLDETLKQMKLRFG